jgi:hypothetical protein
MSFRLSLIAAGAALVLATSAFAAPQDSGKMAAPAAKKTMTAQQQRMADCSKQSAGKKGDERKAFMSACLKGKGPMAMPMKQTQQEKMKSCNVEAKAKALKGDARKAFMSTCLKGDASAPTQP